MMELENNESGSITLFLNISMQYIQNLQTNSVCSNIIVINELEMKLSQIVSDICILIF